MVSHVFNSTFTLNPALCSLLFQISYEAAHENIRAQQKAECDSMMLDDASEAEPASMAGP